MKLLLENGHIAKNKRYKSAIVEDATNKLLYFYDAYGAWTKWYSSAPAVATTPGQDLDNQTLSLTGKVLSISGGNSIDISSIDTNNPNQTLSLSGNVLSLTNGGTVTLPSTSSSSSVPVIKEVSANYTVLDADDIVIATAGNITISLQDAGTARVRAITIKNEGTSSVTFKAVTGQTVDGVNTSTIVADQSLTIVPKSGKWRII